MNPQLSELTMVTAYINTSQPGRLRDAQMGFLRGALKFGITPIFYPDVRGERPKMKDIMQLARETAQSGWMIWCNSDCELIDDPRKYLKDASMCYGFHRLEYPSKEVCAGVDMFVLPCELWDSYLSKDVPDMFVGITHVDWWISRGCEKIGKYYDVAETIILHPSHPVTNISVNLSSSPIAAHNFKNFHEWAERNGVDRQDR